ncbi:activating signal cointegrator 1 complex subunit 1, partial [Tanacetum coccineum]
MLLFRIERALNFTLSCQLSKSSIPYFQFRGVKYNYNVYKMSGGNSHKRTADGKNQKSIASVWRPVSTQSCSAEGMEVNDPNIGPTTLSNKEEDTALEGSLSSTDKHSISLQELPCFASSKEKVMKVLPPDSVARASERIQLIIDDVVKSSALDYSHFISLPLAIHPQLVEKLVGFQNSVLGMNDTTPDEVSQVAVTIKAQENTEKVEVDVSKIPLNWEIEKSIFIKPKTFHLTVLMLKLWNKERVATAVRIFEDCMKGSLAKARVLYAPVEVLGGEERLLHACIACDSDEYKAQEKVLQSMFILTTKYTKKFDSFDARGVMEKYGSEDWGEYLIPDVHLSQIFEFDQNGYYHCCASMPLPKNMEFKGVNYNYNVYKMSGGNSHKRTADGKNQKSIASVWRPVSTQSCSAEGMEVNDSNIGPTTLSNKEENTALEGSLSSTANTRSPY